MDIEAISGAATVAVACAIVFILAARSFQILVRTLGPGHRFAASIMREAAQHYRDEFDQLRFRQSTYLSAGLVFVILFVAAYELNAGRLFLGYPLWQLYLFLSVLVIGAIYAAYRLLRTVVATRQIKLLCDANIAVGHQLQRFSADIGRVFHDIATSAGAVDHVLVGPGGLYAINVIARRPRKNGDVRLEKHALVFLPGETRISIVDINARNSRLEKRFTRALGHRVRVRSVLAVPGWNIEAQISDEHLLVNEKNLPMLRGWKDPDGYLMNEDVDALTGLLTSQCRLGKVDS